MALNAKKIKNVAAGPKQPHMEAGTYPCRLVQIVDLGIQDQRAFDGQAKPPCQTLRCVWEFTDEFCVDDKGNEQLDKPRWLKDEFPFRSLDLDLATSTKRYKALDPEDKFDGDFTQLLGQAANVTVVNKEGKGKNAGNIYNNIGAVTAMRKRDADKCAPLVNPATLFVVDEPDMAVFNSLPDWLQDIIKANHDYSGSELEGLITGKKEPKPKAKEAPAYDEDVADAPW